MIRITIHNPGSAPHVEAALERVGRLEKLKFEKTGDGYQVEGGAATIKALMPDLDGIAGIQIQTIADPPPAATGTAKPLLPGQKGRRPGITPRNPIP